MIVEPSNRDERELARYLHLLKIDAALFHFGGLLETLGFERGIAVTNRIRKAVAKDLERSQQNAYAQMEKYLSERPPSVPTESGAA
jgi:hypothetical protein